MEEHAAFAARAAAMTVTAGEFDRLETTGLAPREAIGDADAELPADEPTRLIALIRV